MQGGGTGSRTSARKQADCPLVSALPFHVPLPLAVQLQRLDNGILDLLSGRPRWKILADTLPGHFELFFLVGLFLGLDREDHVLVQSAFLRKLLHFDGLSQRRGAVLALHGGQ